MTPRSSSPDLHRASMPQPAVPVAARFRDLMAGWPSGICVVTGAVAGTPAGCTVTALLPVSADPPLLLVSLAATGRTLAAVLAGGRFGVCVLSAAQGHLGRVFAAGDPAERFARADHSWVAGVPVLHAAAAIAVCAVEQSVQVADHVLVVGRPLWQDRDLAVTPAVWFQRACWSLGPPDGQQ